MKELLLGFVFALSMCNFLPAQGCTLPTFPSAVSIAANAYPYTSLSSGITVNATVVNTPTLSNTSYACNGMTFGMVSPAWWQNASTSVINLTFSVPVSKFSVVVNGTNQSELFTYTSPSGSITLTDFCSPAFTLQAPNSLIYNQVPASGTMISINHAPGATQFTLRHNGVGSGSRIAVLDCFVPATILPVSLVDFNAEYVPSMQVSRLSWSSENEHNSAGFEVQHSTDGENWVEIGFVQGAGNSSSKLTYSFAHAVPPAGLNYYKLKMVDVDGHYTTSETRQIFVEPSQGMAIFPNPSTGIFTILSSVSNGELMLTDLLGRVVHKQVFLGQAELDLSSEARGTYLAVLTNGKGERMQERIVLR